MTNTISAEDAFPLAWPDGWPRTPSSKRGVARYLATFDRALRDLLAELRRMGATHIVVSTNIPLRRDGLPYADMARRRIEDPGVAVYFMRKGAQQVIACDKWSRIEQNVHACGLTINALRGIERAGASELLDRAFTGFKALPPARDVSTAPWWVVLDVNPSTANLAQCRESYRALAQKVHPDKPGGNVDRMALLNKAWDEAQRVVAGRP